MSCDSEFPVVISAAISLQPFFNMDESQQIILSHLDHIISQFIMVLQRVAVEGVMQSFDVLVNRFSSAVMNRSVQIVSVLLQAFKQYTQDEDNDTAMFTAMSTLDCVSSVVMNACQEPMMYDSVVQIVMPVIMVCIDIGMTKIEGICG